MKLAATVLKGSDVLVGTVIGFPHGSSVTSIKVAEAKQAMLDGAVELDMVINIGALRSGKYDLVRDDIKAIVMLQLVKKPSSKSFWKMPI